MRIVLIVLALVVLVGLLKNKEVSTEPKTFGYEWFIENCHQNGGTYQEKSGEVPQCLYFYKK